jgi:hypothetical protein
VIVVVALGLLNTNVIVLGEFLLTDTGENDFMRVGGAITVRLAVLLGLPAEPVSVEATPDVVFG